MRRRLAVMLMFALARPALAGGFVVGADLSSLAQERAAGAVYRDSGAVVDPLRLALDAGWGMVRLRLWNAPAEPWNGLDSTLAAAHRVRAAGLAWMLDLHYSDTWADPGHQPMPAAWRSLAFPALRDSVYAFTRAVMHACVIEGVPPAAVQVGNEIEGGLLWDAGRVGWPGSAWDTSVQWSRLTALLAAASRGVHDAFPPGRAPEVLVHLSTSGNAAHTRWFLDHLSAARVPFDAVGFSYYPWWHGSLAGAEANLRDVASRYGKRVWIVETSYPWTLASADRVGNFVTSEAQLLPGYPASPEGQLAFLEDVVALERRLPGGLGAGVLVWEPELLAVPGGPSDPSENLTLFDFSGRALPGLRFGAPRVAPR